MNAKRARGKLWMEAWRFSTKRLAVSQLDRLALRNAVAAVDDAELAPVWALLRGAARDCAASGPTNPLTDEMINRLASALDLAAKASKASKANPAMSPCSSRVDRTSLNSGEPSSSHLYWREGQYA